MNFKQIIFISSLTGMFCAPLCFIPIIKNFTFLFLVFLIGAAVSFYLKKKNFLNDFSYQNAMITGGIIGASSFLAFCIIFIPLILIVSFFFKDYYSYGIPYLMNFAGFWLLLLIIGMLAGISALINSVGALGVSYFYDLIESKDFKSELTNSGKNNRMD